MNVNRIIAKLRSSDAEREDAMQRLIEHGDGSVAPLVDALSSQSDPLVREAAAEALRRLAPHVGDDAGAAIEDALLDVVVESAELGLYAWGVKEAMAYAGERGGPRARDALVAALRSDEMFIPEYASAALAELGDPRVVPELVAALLRAADRGYGMDDIMNSLVRFGDVAAEALLSALTDARGVRVSAIEGALRTLARTATSPLLAALAAAQANVRATAAAALDAASAEQAVDPLIEALGDPEPAVAAAAARSLGELGEPRAGEALIEALHTGDPLVRAAATTSLAPVEGPAAVAPLAGLLGDGDAWIRACAVDALATLGAAAVDPLVPLLSAPESEIRIGAATSLGRIGGPAIEPLRGCVEAADWRTRQAAAIGLGWAAASLAPDSAGYDEREVEPARRNVEVLLPLLDDDEFPVRKAAAAALGQIGDPESLPRLRVVLERRDDGARRAALQAVLNLGDDASDMLLDALHAPDPALRTLAADAIADYFERSHGGYFPRWFGVTKTIWHVGVSEGATAITGTLAELASDPDEPAREAAGRAAAAVHHALEEKRLHGEPDVLFMIEGPIPESQLHLEVEAERVARETAAAAATRPPRYADLAVYDDPAGEDPLPADRPLKTGVWYRVEVAVRATTKGVPAEGEREPIREPSAEGPVRILVTAEGDGFEVEEPIAALELPAEGDSTENAWFRIRASEPGRAAITMRLYYNLNLLEVIKLLATVVRPSDAGGGGALKVRQERLDTEYEALHALEPRALHVEVARKAPGFEFRFTVSTGAGPDAVFVAPVRLTPDELEGTLDDIRALWYDVAFGASARFRADRDGDSNTDLRRLAQAGRRLWVAVFRREIDGAAARVGELLEASPPPPGATVQVSIERSAEDFVFPWALLYDRPVAGEGVPVDPNGFWGVRYVVEQIPPLGPRPREKGVDRSSPIRLGFMLWERFRNAADQKSLMERLEDSSTGEFDATDPIVDADTCYDVLDGNEHDILYFYTHGHARRPAGAAGGDGLELFRKRYERLDADDPLREEFSFLYDSVSRGTFEIDRSYIQLTLKKIYLDEAYDRIVAPIGRSPLVILNMCDSAQLVPSLSDSFVHFFLTRRASAVLGTECPMTVAFAHPFSERLLSNLLSGMAVGEALRDARRSFLAEGSPLGLAYTLYGSAFVRFHPPALPTPPAAARPGGSS